MILLKNKFVWISVIIILYLVFTSIFICEQSEIIIVTQFGDPVRVIQEPGLKFKLPYPFQNLHRYDNRVNLFDPPYAEFLTKDKKNLLIDTFVCWRIVDPVEFLKTVNNKSGAESRLLDFVFADVGALLGTTPLDYILSVNKDQIQTDELEMEIQKRLDKKGREELGVEILAFRIKRINYPEQNKRSVFERMVAERERIATQFRSEGEEESLKIKSAADREKAQVISEAEKEAEIVKGKADAEATRIYANAFKQYPGFYKFIRTLRAYEKIITDNSIIVVPSDSALLKYLNNPEAD
ncbi:MAG: protease modulator HflC [Acidobacteria bacterium]|nr:protease modulator HflC [Acidobacteriota bacterium]